MTSPAQVVTAEAVDPQALAAFLERMYPPLKAGFLNQHGEWWHGSNANRLVALVDGQVAGYCAVIPARVWVAGQVHEALWWVDLVIAPEFRGRGLQTLFDERVKKMSPLLLGFPNELAAKIHRKHGWGVREDLPIVLSPLRPLKVKSVLGAAGWRKWLHLAGAVVLSPLAALWRVWCLSLQTTSVWKLVNFNADTLAAVFLEKTGTQANTTWRDATYFNWRYGQSPELAGHEFFCYGDPSSPTHALVLRHISEPGGARYSRILDVIGDMSNQTALDALVCRAVQSSIRHGSGQVTMFAATRGLLQAARRYGFLFSARVGFCWLSNDMLVMNALAGQNYWSLADSDNDAPD